MEDKLRKLRKQAFTLLSDTDIAAGRTKDVELRNAVHEDVKRLSEGLMTETQIEEMNAKYRKYKNGNQERQQGFDLGSGQEAR